MRIGFVMEAAAGPKKAPIEEQKEERDIDSRRIQELAWRAAELNRMRTALLQKLNADR